MPMLKTQARQKTAFLTGASSGIGKATAAALTRAGYCCRADKGRLPRDWNQSASRPGRGA
jgi:NAD(P)-dependent dehydrogenase (short-subunit alcohol dehydrogenase family)